MTVSTAPPAPRPWPVSILVEYILVLAGNSASATPASTVSLRRVPLPWALT